MMTTYIDMKLQQTIRRILREEDYSPAGKEIIPNKIVIHKSNPMFRDKILQDGLKVRAGECYKIYVGYGIKCRPAIFATNSTNKRAWFDSTYDDDIWEINTEMIPDVKWFKDRHYESRSKHIVTFQDIPREAITLKYKGTGSGDVRTWDKDSPNIVRESIRRILKEELNSYVRRRVDLSDEKVKNQIKQEILSHSNLLKQQDEVVIEFVSDFTTQELLKWFNQEEYDEHYDSVSDYIKENYSDFILEYFHETFKENDDSTYCFIKHSERYGGRGFTECFGSWYSFLNRFGSWLPDVDWNKVQEKLKTENKILLARPLEGHIYEYYFSVLKK